jgi:tol-pal system protein YbgF
MFRQASFQPMQHTSMQVSGYRLPALLLCAVLAGCATTSPEQDPTVQKLTELEGRLLRIERVLTNQSLLEMSQRLEKAQAETRALRGQLEELQHNAGRAQDQQRELYADLDRRLQAVESGGRAGGSGVSGGAGALPVPQGDDRANYQAAFDLLKDGKYSAAINGFKQFLTSFPQSALADNARYWLGEAYYVSKDYQQALRAFRTVIEKHPESRKLPDALLKVGYCQYELKNFNDAKAALTQVVQQFPETTAARLASQRLSRMEGEG